MARKQIFFHGEGQNIFVDRAFFYKNMQFLLLPKSLYNLIRFYRFPKPWASWELLTALSLAALPQTGCTKSCPWPRRTSPTLSCNQSRMKKRRSSGAFLTPARGWMNMVKRSQLWMRKMRGLERGLTKILSLPLPLGIPVKWPGSGRTAEWPF